MSKSISSIASPYFGQVRILLPRVEGSHLNNLSLTLRSKIVQVIKKIADFGAFEPHSVSPPIPHHRQSGSHRREYPGGLDGKSNRAN